MSKSLIQNNEQIEETTVGREFEPVIFALKKRYRKISLLNGGVDAHRLELLVIRYINHLFTPSVYKICGLIEQLGVSV